MTVNGTTHEERTLVPLMTVGEFFTPAKPTHLVVPELGIASGPPTGVIGDGYAGKTMTVLSAGMAVALGKPLWDRFQVRQGPWLHLDHEQGAELTKERVHRMARGFDVSDDELRDLLTQGTIRLAVYPDLNLETPKAVDHYRRAFTGMGIITCDSLRKMHTSDENGSHMRNLIGVLSVASDKESAPVMMIHHSGNAPLNGSTRQRSDMGRGSSGIKQEFQGYFVMTKKRTDKVALVSHEKERWLKGELVADFGLRVDDVHGKWGLRVAYVARSQMPTAPTSESKDITEDVYKYVLKHPGIEGIEVLAKAMGKAKEAVRAAFQSLEAAERVERRRGPNRGNSQALYAKETECPDLDRDPDLE